MGALRGRFTPLSSRGHKAARRWIDALQTSRYAKECFPHGESGQFGSDMAIHIKTNTPKKLLAAYKKAIDERRVTTWSYDSDGDFTHTADQWIRKAWLRPKVVERKEVILYILAPVESPISSAVYAIYHGRFIESMLRHCDGLFEEAMATAGPESGDITGQ